MSEPTDIAQVLRSWLHARRGGQHVAIQTSTVQSAYDEIMALRERCDLPRLEEWQIQPDHDSPGLFLACSALKVRDDEHG